ncbi:MAG: thiamine monophosphate synthase [Phenylobacterium sp.]|nr:MAG: thiamine monophosphate synthase [Phenylobacterium sp.]
MSTFWTLERTAALLNRAAGRRKGLPHLLFFTDPARTPDACAIAETLPRGAAIVFRAFGAADAEAQALRLKAIARRRGLKLLIGADAQLAARIRADGVHLPERLAANSRRLKAAHLRWIVTCAAHSLQAARRAGAFGADAAVVSAVFASRSPSAGAPIGPLRLAPLVRAAGLPAYALGGINNKTARRLKDAGLVGLAGVEGLRT